MPHGRAAMAESTPARFSQTPEVGRNYINVFNEIRRVEYSSRSLLIVLAINCENPLYTKVRADSPSRRIADRGRNAVIGR